MMIGFILTFFSVLFFLHLIIYFFAVRFFAITTKKNKIILAVVLFLLSISFIGSAILTRMIDNKISGLFYFLSGLWVGSLINLLMAIVVASVILLICKKINKKIDAKLLGMLAMSVTLVFSIFGVWNVFHPQIKRIEVSIENLPAEWQGKTIVQITDLHLGSILREGFLLDVIEKVNSLNPEIVVITGDLFDGMDGNIKPLAKLLDNIKTKKGIYYITGNHETYIGVGEALSVLSLTKVKVLNDEVVHLDGLQILGISYPEMGQVKNIKAIVEANQGFSQTEPTILLYHAPTSIDHTDIDSRGNIYFGPNTDFSDTQAFGIDLQLSGHTHQGQIFPFTILAKLIYNGYDHGLHKISNFNIYTSSGTGVWGPTLRTGSRSEITAIILK